MEPPDKAEVWLALEPDKLVMQIALTMGKGLIMKSLQSQPHIIEVTKSTRQGPSIWLKRSAEFM
jgi:hypothetical protein